MALLGMTAPEEVKTLVERGDNLTQVVGRILAELVESLIRVEGSESSALHSFQEAEMGKSVEEVAQRSWEASHWLAGVGMGKFVEVAIGRS
jgi:hypothetical protein